MDDVPDVICSEAHQRKFESLFKKAPSKELKKKVGILGQSNTSIEDDPKAKSSRKRKAVDETKAEGKNPLKKQKKSSVSLEDKKGFCR